MLLKHEISIADITNDLAEGILPKIETIEEKFGDNLIYLILKKASIIDKDESLSGKTRPPRSTLVGVPSISSSPVTSSCVN